MWVLNVAHVFFLQETKFKEAIRYYEPTVKKHAAAILQVLTLTLTLTAKKHAAAILQVPAIV